MSGTMEENHTAEVEMLHSVKVALKGAVLAVETMEADLRKVAANMDKLSGANESMGTITSAVATPPQLQQ
ncbi:uncharacterized protein AMSG_07597 [Thecamonas trahens ATCC 50062]|uniref:Uncharacterized protein n=1 Tax=Thecamonas trahens ATCC 50062 TaxID=461836 RepID=A0A0L0DGZ7_THETB|nr:hypothetical protein AMSG_07597 [Thecamonas trahens ATCC 50062]KNC51411.1 hypothetical protein AMSG_07597 [Thecamonas trahens ATCC 50062]|eukprot:XP_013756078.1 hypothetical protein AMSG_07597 [Thecamonas trahens ATCC 50062]